jgi:hypothetical protein
MTKLEQLRLPADISSDGHEVWDWAERLSEHLMLWDEIEKVKINIKDLMPACGS